MAEAPRPGATGEHHGIAGDRSFLGDHARDASGRSLEPAHGAAGNDASTFGTRSERDCRGGFEWLGAAVIFGVEGALPSSSRAGLKALGFLGSHEPGRETKGTAIAVVPFLPRGELGFGLAEINDAALTEAGLRAHPLIDAAPGFQRFKDKRNLAGIAAHLAAPSPVSAGLLAGNDTFLNK